MGRWDLGFTRQSDFRPQTIYAVTKLMFVFFKLKTESRLLSRNNFFKFFTKLLVKNPFFSYTENRIPLEIHVFITRNKKLIQFFQMFLFGRNQLTPLVPIRVRGFISERNTAATTEQGPPFNGFPRPNVSVQSTKSWDSNPGPLTCTNECASRTN